MFGFSFGELIVLVIVGLVVIGPKELPKVLRKAGQWAGKLRRMASEIRVQSGIDEVLKGEGIADDIREIRKLARGELDQVVQGARLDAPLPNDPYGSHAGGGYSGSPGDAVTIDRDREYPREGADSYRALPDTAIVYADTLPRSPLARDPLYVLGDARAVVPQPEQEPAHDPTSEPGAESESGHP